MGYLLFLQDLLASEQVVPADAEKGVTVSGEKDKEILQTFLLSGEAEVGTPSSTTPKPIQNNTKAVEKEKKKKKSNSTGTI